MASHAYLASESIAEKQMMDFHVIALCVFVQEKDFLMGSSYCTVALLTSDSSGEQCIKLLLDPYFGCRGSLFHLKLGPYF